MVVLGFVALIPFTTDALGDHGQSAGQVPTVVYAANVAIVSGAEVVLYLIARQDGLFRRSPTPAEARRSVIGQLLPAVVFAGSIPVAVLGSETAARYCWLSLPLLSPAVGRALDRRAASTTQEGSAH